MHTRRFSPSSILPLDLSTTCPGICLLFYLTTTSPPTTLRHIAVDWITFSCGQLGRVPLSRLCLRHFDICPGSCILPVGNPSVVLILYNKIQPSSLAICLPIYLPGLSRHDRYTLPLITDQQRLYLLPLDLPGTISQGRNSGHLQSSVLPFTVACSSHPVDLPAQLLLCSALLGWPGLTSSTNTRAVSGCCPVVRSYLPNLALVRL